MKNYKYQLVGFMIIMILAACSPGIPEEIDMPLETELPSQVVEAQAWLANQLDVEPPEIEIQSVERVEWSDSCFRFRWPCGELFASDHTRLANRFFAEWTGI